MELGYTFQNKALLKLALTHSSYAHEKQIESNQRLEFLGDSILSFVVASYLYETYPDLDEGRLTQIRADAVCEKSLAAAARRMHLGDQILFGKSETLCGGKEKDSILADTFEAVLGALYLDADMEAARTWIMENLQETIDASRHADFTNYKSELQNYFQKRDKSTRVVTYHLIERQGPDHKPTFKVEARYEGKTIGEGIGSSRKEAEQMAAKQAFLKR